MSLLTVKLFVNVITLTVQTELDTSNTRSLRGDRGSGAALRGRSQLGGAAEAAGARQCLYSGKLALALDDARGEASGPPGGPGGAGGLRRAAAASLDELDGDGK